MSSTTVTCGSRHELATRVNGGLEITLVWDRRDNSTSIDIRHGSTAETISFRVPPGRALDAFHHPFVYLANQVEDNLQPNDLDNPWRNGR